MRERKKTAEREREREETKEEQLERPLEGNPLFLFIVYLQYHSKLNQSKSNRGGEKKKPPLMERDARGKNNEKDWQVS